MSSDNEYFIFAVRWIDGGLFERFDIYFRLQKRRLSTKLARLWRNPEWVILLESVLT